MPTIMVKRFSRSKVPDPQPQPEPEQSIKFIQEEKPERYEETEHEGYSPDEEEHEDTDNEFLADLHKSNYNPIDPKQEKEDLKRLKQEQREQEKKDKENERMIKRAEKSLKTSKPRTPVSHGNDDDIFSDTPTPIMGKDRLILQKKISQYKSLFADELKGFKVKKNASSEELKASLEEMETIVQVGTLDEFITDSVLQSIKLVEGVSSITKSYNISGLSDLLKSNPQFHKLLKQLYVKYNTFSQIPPEYQLLMLVATSSWICVQKNRNKNTINSYLNEPIPIPTNK